MAAPGNHAVSIQDRPATDTGVHYSLPEVVAMRKRELVRIFESMKQAVSKRQPTPLPLLGTVVTLLCDMISLQKYSCNNVNFSAFQCCE